MIIEKIVCPVCWADEAYGSDDTGYKCECGAVTWNESEGEWQQTDTLNVSILGKKSSHIISK